MGKVKRTNHPKEEFISPRVTCAEELELENELLGTSQGPYLAPVQTMGQEYVDYGASYFEGNWN